ncbi:hypothetical protein SDC9_189017 [bioreactor metagenome]|uniref:Type I restriction modification DNA specificity domain-containing protein n=1 Tax=bioreactor metagenome TaxID=1076179 RepID=A0A645HQY4_9ZZZZ
MWLKHLTITGTGTTQQQLTVPDFKKTEILVPKIDIMKSFSEIANVLYEKILFLKRENDKLMQIRDSILPKLMSGEIDVSEAEVRCER